MPMPLHSTSDLLCLNVRTQTLFFKPQSALQQQAVRA